MTAYVVGVDASLRSTAIAFCWGLSDGTLHKGLRLVFPRDRGADRLVEIRDGVIDAVGESRWGADLVVLEGLAPGARGRAVTELGGLHWVLRVALHEDRRRVLVVPPNVRAMFATGRGNAGKTEVVVAARERFGYDGVSDDEADAVVLREIGCHLLGQPTVALPQTHLRALKKLQLPEETA